MAAAALLIAPFLAIVTVMLSWRRGASLLDETARRREAPLAQFVAMLERRSGL